MLGIIIQARTNSTRLPNKVILPFFENKTILDILIEKFKLYIPEYRIIVATTTSKSDNKIVELSEKQGVIAYRGSEEDVLKRFVEAAEVNSLDRIVRICSDNPFLDVIGLKVLIDYFSYTNSDYCSFMYNNTPVIKTHFGLWGECISLNALKRVEEETIDLIYREHVTNYIYTHPSSFDIKLIDVPEIVRKNKGIRLTVDTIDDFRIAQKLYTSTRNNQSIEYLINEIVNDNYLLETMRVQIKANTK